MSESLENRKQLNVTPNGLANLTANRVRAKYREFNQAALAGGAIPVK